ncbi:MAG TPA: SEC-C domain-containing protein [Candidatus Dormibacteraeota bacterium]|nr:SEC-C domain-containing protein [Candidatus Dormibacteraeota bacterium]
MNMTGLGRNDPCHCGSGRKYKRCCLPKDAAARGPVPLRAFSQRERHDAAALLGASVLERSSPFHADAAFGQIEFFGEEFAQVPEADQERAAAQEPCASGFIWWLALDRPIAEGETIASLLSRSPNARLTRGQRTYLERLMRSRMGVYEVRDVRRDQGLTLVDLWTNEVHEVSERLATHSLVRYDVLGARLMEGPLGETEIDGAVYPFSQEDAAGLLTALRGEWSRWRKKNPDAGEQDFLKRTSGALINRYWLHRVFLRPLPKLATTDGEPVELCKIVFDVLDEGVLRTALAGEETLAADGDGGYTWFEPGDGRRILGSLTLSTRRLTVETMNRARAQLAKDLLERLGGGALRHRLTEHTSIEQALAEHRKRPQRGRREREIPPELEQQITADYLTEHYRRWMDEPIPALGGRTPRHAVKLKTLRPKVVTLLKDLERMSERSRAEGHPAIDVAWLWTELGLTD